MIDLTGINHHPAIEEIVEVLCAKTQNTDKGFFRTEAAFFFGKMAAAMRATILTKDRGEIPVNIYALALATSGFGKGHSVHIFENEFLMGFKKRFMEDTFPVVAEKNLWDIANDRAAKNGNDPQEEFDKVAASFKRAGAYPFTFDSGTTPAVKQLRNKLLLANCGSINMQVDEIGSNLEGSAELLNLYLELYDQGIVKQKLTKNTPESQRDEEIDGKTPTNMLLFGTPAKLLDGGPTEDAFYSLLETGYARRCLFGWGQQDRKASHSQTPEEIYQKLIQPQNSSIVTKWATRFHGLADPARFGWEIELEDDVAVELIRYKKSCEQMADALADHKEIQKAELSHRYFKALKLAGAYAFIDGSNKLSIDNLKQAILLVEESGEAFKIILNREKTYVKLARYIAAEDTELTHADLHEALPFYKTGNAARNEMISLATAWGYKQHILIKKTFVDGIEFFHGETLQETNLDELTLSYSDHFAYHYEAQTASFEQLHLLTQADGLHWCNHAFKNEHRAEENVLVGFNMIVIDVDGGTPIATVHELLKEYKFMTYTTKRHTDEDNRFRIILPMNYRLELEADDYHAFMNSIVEWLPFKTDEEANQRSRKWLSCAEGVHHYNTEGAMFDVLKFIPKTSKNEEFKSEMKKVESMDNLERWFAQRIASGNRNNQMVKFALTLVDGGMDFYTVQAQVHAFNKKLNNPLAPNEIENTIMQTVAKKLSGK
jgi:hypothetical protein